MQIGGQKEGGGVLWLTIALKERGTRKVYLGYWVDDDDWRRRQWSAGYSSDTTVPELAEGGK